MATAPVQKPEDQISSEKMAEMKQIVADKKREKAEEKAYNAADMTPDKAPGKRKGGCVKMAKGGYVRKADGIAQRGKTRGKMV